MFTDYTKALGERDWDEACEHLAPETTDKLKANVAQLGLTDAPDDCVGLMGALYAQIDKDPTAKKTIDDITQTAKISAVKVDGDTRHRQLEREGQRHRHARHADGAHRSTASGSSST